MNCQASIEENHPVHKEYVKPESSELLQFSPRVDNDGKTIVDHKASSQSEQSIAALGKMQLTCNSLASVHILLTHLILSAAHILRWKLPGQQEALANVIQSPDDNLCQTQSPY
jgi:hypothetical protein